MSSSSVCLTFELLSDSETKESFDRIWSHSLSSLPTYKDLPRLASRVLIIKNGREMCGRRSNQKKWEV
jgi:hypothetical protein